MPHKLSPYSQSEDAPIQLWKINSQLREFLTSKQLRASDGFSVEVNLQNNM